MPSSPELKELSWLKELIDFRFKASDAKMEDLTKAIERLSGAIITAEVFNELAHDVKRAVDKSGDNTDRIRNLEEQVRVFSEQAATIKTSTDKIRTLEEKVRLWQKIVAGIALVVGPIVIDRLQQLFN